MAKSFITAKYDSAASTYYLMNDDKSCLKNRKQCVGPNVTFPDATKTSPTEEGELPLPPEFSTAAKKGTVLPHLKSTSLISVGPLCDDNKLVVFDKNKVYFYKEQQLPKHYT